MAGFGMLGIICVPGTPPRLIPLGEESGLDPSGACGGADFGVLDVRVDIAIASTSAPRPESTLLVASGETCGLLLGSPTPGVVVASSRGIDGGGGP